MKFSEKIEPVDLIAIVVLVCGFTLMALHIDSVVGAAITLIIGYYFGHKRKNESSDSIK